MPLVTTKEMFKKAYEGGYAIGAFNVNNMEIVQGITRAAKKLNAPVILQCSAGARKYASHDYLVARLRLPQRKQAFRLLFILITAPILKPANPA